MTISTKIPEKGLQLLKDYPELEEDVFDLMDIYNEDCEEHSEHYAEEMFNNEIDELREAREA